MGTLTLSELIEEINVNLSGETTGRDDVSQARVVRALNIVQDQVARRKDFEEFEQTYSVAVPFTGVVATDRFIDFSTINSGNFRPREIYSLVILDGTRSQPLSQPPARRFDRMVPNPEAQATAEPTHAVRWANRFELYPIPDKAYTLQLRCKVWPSAFSVGSLSALSDFDRKDDLLIYGAAEYIFRTLSMIEEADLFLKKFEIELSSAVLDELTQPDRQIVAFSDPRTPSAPIEPWTDPMVK